MKLWIDDLRPAPAGYEWLKSTDDAIARIKHLGRCGAHIEVLDMDHDAGDYVQFGGDYIKILDFLEEVMVSIPIHLHSQNPVGVQNMRAIIQRNGWKEIF